MFLALFRKGAWAGFFWFDLRFGGKDVRLRGWDVSCLCSGSCSILHNVCFTN